MKKLLLLPFLFLAITTQAQTVGDIPCDSLKAPYIEVSVVMNNLTGKFTASVDFGQPVGGKNLALLENNKKVNFNSPMGAVNYLAQYGYKLALVDKGVFYMGRKKGGLVEQ